MVQVRHFYRLHIVQIITYKLILFILKVASVRYEIYFVRKRIILEFILKLKKLPDPKRNIFSVFTRSYFKGALKEEYIPGIFIP